MCEALFTSHNHHAAKIKQQTGNGKSCTDLLNNEGVGRVFLVLGIEWFTYFIFTALLCQTNLGDVQANLWTHMDRRGEGELFKILCRFVKKPNLK